MRRPASHCHAARSRACSTRTLGFRWWWTRLMSISAERPPSRCWPIIPNLLVVRTFSKSRALAGLRVGYALGFAVADRGAVSRKKLLSFLSGRTHRPGGRDRLGRGRAYFQSSLKIIVAERESMAAQLRELGFEVRRRAPISSSPGTDRKGRRTETQALRDRAVLIRHFAAPRIDDYLRITVGTAEADKPTDECVSKDRLDLAAVGRIRRRTAYPRPFSRPSASRHLVVFIASGADRDAHHRAGAGYRAGHLPSTRLSFFLIRKLFPVGALSNSIRIELRSSETRSARSEIVFARSIFIVASSIRGWTFCLVDRI